jgi:GAF domain-containing protein
MERGAKPAKSKVKARPSVTGKPRRVEASAGLEHKQRLAEALEQHAAISEILRVISNSPGDVTPVLAAVAERAAHLCDASFAQVLLVEGNVLRPTVAYWADAAPDERYGDSGGVKRTWPLTRNIISGRAVLDCKTIHHADVVPLVDSEYPDARAKQQELGMRAVLVVPLMRESEASGVIFMFRRLPRPFSPAQVELVQTFARQARIAIDNARLFRETKEALEQQTATSEILRVISRSPGDVRAMLRAVAERALKLCEAADATIFMVEGDALRAVARIGSAMTPLQEGQSMPLNRGSVTGRAVVDRMAIHVEDLATESEEEFPIGRRLQRRLGHHTALSVPLMREDRAIGGISLWRMEARRFSDKQVALVNTFADQAAIAIENVRLFNETREALERQTATAEVLKVISESPTDVQPVFEAVAKRAGLLCRADGSRVWRMIDGELRTMTRYGPADSADLAESLPLSRTSVAGRAILERRVIHVDDVLPLIPTEYPDIAELQKRHDFRTVLIVPLLREGEALGVISLVRNEVRPFTPEEIGLVQTFADQAVIAIENVRLFNETKEALEQQTATSEILRVISQSPRDVQPVFDIIAATALRLCRAASAHVVTFDGELIRLGAVANLSHEGADALRHLFPRPPSRDLGTTRAVLMGCVTAIPDVLKDTEYALQATAVAERYRSVLAVPLLRKGNAIGAIGVARPAPGSFPDTQVALLKTFADQAVIAIENVRLFKELEARTTQLTRSVEELRALGEVGQAVSSTLDLETVLSTIVSRATALAGMDAGAIYGYDEPRGEFYLHAVDRLEDEVVTALRAGPIRKGEGALGRMAMVGEPAQIRDIMTDASYQSRLREAVLRLGYRSLMAVPLMRDDHLLGGLVVYRKTPGDFDAAVIDLLRTFATQSALAIQNARLFREIEEKSRELAMASRHKSEFLANMSHELRTPLNAIIGFSEVLAERMFGEINDKQAEYLADILESGRHLLSLINDILDLSKIEAGRIELEPTEFNLPDAIENTLILVRERAHRRGIALGRMVDERVRTIRADERKVKQVLLNLLSNALKFTPEGGRIDVAANITDNAIEISVSDTGVGIAAEDQAAVFEEFRQVGAASKKIEGTGLGLAISRKFIELHGGKIWVTSQVGTGSTFAFTLPLQ